ncbi:hypothetical protein JYT96_00150 [Gammaproteobacteria bacterium AH-315-C21]|nr:hypothetical protein [Gammaproteobacteria bacterium AH-315-C21]
MVSQARCHRRLASITLVHAIRGNIDKDDWAQHYPETLSLRIAQQLFHIVHDIKQLDRRTLGDDVAVIVSTSRILPMN